MLRQVLRCRRELSIVLERNPWHGGGILAIYPSFNTTMGLKILSSHPPYSPSYPSYFAERSLHSCSVCWAKRNDDGQRPKTFPPLPEVHMTPVEEQRVWLAGTLSPPRYAKSKRQEKKEKKKEKKKKKEEKKKKVEQKKKKKKKTRQDIPCPPSQDSPWAPFLLLALAALGGFALLRYLGVFGGKKHSEDYGPKFPGLGGPRRRKPRYQHPPTVEDIPRDVKYLIIGGGTAGLSAAKGIMQIDSDAQVLIISAENALPYKRNPLSKDLEVSKASIFYEQQSFFHEPKGSDEHHKGISLARGWMVEKLDLTTKQAYLPKGHTVTYQRCLLATGSVPYNLRIFEKTAPDISKRITVLHDLCDYETLRSAVREGAQDIVIVGSNARACEIAWMLCSEARKGGLPRVFLVYPQKTLMPDLIPPYLGAWLATKMKSSGVYVHPESRITKVKTEEDHLLLRLNWGQKLQACRVIVSAYSAPDTFIAGPSKLTVDKEIGGFMANNELRTEADVWAAGDCVSYCAGTGGRLRAQGTDHAAASGTVAGRNMARSMDLSGEETMKCYDHFPVHYGTPCVGVKFEALGNTDPMLPTVGVFASAKSTGVDPRAATHHTSCPSKPDVEPSTEADFSRGVVFYLRNDEVVGLILWNLPDRLGAARDIVEGGYYYKDLDVAMQQLCLHSQ